MKYYLIAGEASGDLHASNLMRAIQHADPQADFRFLGGDLMKRVGGTLVKHYREMAFMGFIPVLMNLRTILRNMQVCREDIRQYRPDVVILIDYPGFNLKIAKYVKTVLHIPVHYYISPKIWAWKQYRIKDFRKYVDHLYSILPFEPAFFHRLNYEVDYVGNPSVDSVSNYQMRESVGRSTFFRMNRLADKPILALLAGSRKQEIRDNLPVMLRVAARFRNISRSSPELRELIRNITGNIPIRLYRFCFSRPIRSCSIATWLSLHPERLRSRLPCSVFRRWFATTCRPDASLPLFSSIFSIRLIFRWSI